MAILIKYDVIYPYYPNDQNALFIMSTIQKTSTVSATNTIITKHSSSGFTLIEVLVAMAIFAVLSVMAYSGLRTVINVSSGVQNHVERLEALQRTFMFLERDFYQLIPRTMSVDGGNARPALEAVSNATRLFEFTRGGQPNPADVQQNSLIRIAYFTDEDKLKRIKWNTLDHISDDRTIEMTLLDNVESIKTRFLDKNNEWRTNWGQNQADKETLPKAIEITLEHKEWGEIRWLLPIYAV